jgi:hypothetical protein
VSRKLLLPAFAALQEGVGGSRKLLLPGLAATGGEGGDRTLWKSISKKAWASSIFALGGYVWKQDLEDRRASKQY